MIFWFQPAQWERCVPTVEPSSGSPRSVTAAAAGLHSGPFSLSASSGKHSVRLPVSCGVVSKAQKGLLDESRSEPSGAPRQKQPGDLGLGTRGASGIAPMCLGGSYPHGFNNSFRITATRQSWKFSAPKAAEGCLWGSGHIMSQVIPGAPKPGTSHCVTGKLCKIPPAL